MKKEITKISNETSSLLDDNIDKLKSLFPEIITDGNKIDFDVLKNILSEEVDDAEEKYKFTWHGKSQMMHEMQKASTGTLRPDLDSSVNFEESNNIYIEGDNYEVLKILRENYTGKVKMIYIDPPYNKRKDFIYDDDYKDNMQNYIEKTKQNSLKNKEKTGRYHTRWLNMIYPRLRVARELLREDGVIFISIDDNEQANLKKVCDEIFGEDNFISSFIWEKTYSPKNNNKYVSDNHEMILCYTKSKYKIDKFNRLPRTDKADAFYKYDDNDGKGKYGLADLTIGGMKGYDIKWNGLTFKEAPTAGWRFSESKMYELLKEGRIYIPDDESKRPRYKRYLSEVDGIISKTILNYEVVGHTDSSKKALNELVGNNVFDYPKPIKLIEHFIRLVSSRDDIILDFFSGSSTTAHSVMKMNAEDDGSRKFIMVNLPEQIDKKSSPDAYDFCVNELKEEPVITTIGKERIRRAAEKIKKDYQDKEYINDLDFGFKVFKLDQSNIRTVNYEEFFAEALDNEDTIIEGRSSLDVLYEIMIKSGYPLDTKYQKVSSDFGAYYSIDSGKLFVFLDTIKLELIETMIAKHEINSDTKIVIKESLFNGQSRDSDKFNIIDALKKVGIANIRSI